MQNIRNFVVLCCKVDSLADLVRKCPFRKKCSKSFCHYSFQIFILPVFPLFCMYAWPKNISVSVQYLKHNRKVINYTIVYVVEIGS